VGDAWQTRTDRCVAASKKIPAMRGDFISLTLLSKVETLTKNYFAVYATAQIAEAGMLHS
jgi:hypothetical protein